MNDSRVVIESFRLYSPHMGLAKQQIEVSVEDYLAGEPEAQVRHEYVNGQVYAMAGATLRHNTISLNLALSLKSQLRGRPCTPYMSDVKVQVRTLASESYYYPDVVVSCDPRDTNPQYLEYPSTVIEVLSESTERIDRHEKFLAYTSLDSVQEYLLVAQDRRFVTVCRRESGWQPEVFTEEEDTIVLSCGATLTLAEIYEQV